MTAPVAVVGLVGGEPYGSAACDALARAEVIVGSSRHADELRARGLTAAGAPTIELTGALDPIVDRVDAARAEGRRVVVLASGDPGFFGIVRVLAARLGPDALDVHPAPSSVSLAFARVGVHWDDAVVASAHGRPLADAIRAIAGAPKAAVLTSPDAPPQAVGRALLDAGGDAERPVAVASRLGEQGEAVARTDLAGLAAGTFDPLSVVLLLPPSTDGDGPAGTAWTAARPADAPVGWALPEDAFEHRDGMITKAEVRAVVLAKLALPPAGVLWDLGAGSGSVGIEAARLSPGLRVVAVERDPEQVARVRANAEALGVAHAVTAVEGAAPAALADLPTPDRVFVGGGGLDVLDAALDRLAADGLVVATFALVDRAAAAHARLGSMVSLSVARGVALGDGVRLDAQNPVFVCWGPRRA